MTNLTQLIRGDDVWAADDIYRDDVYGYGRRDNNLPNQLFVAKGTHGMVRDYKGFFKDIDDDAYSVTFDPSDSTGHFGHSLPTVPVRLLVSSLTEVPARAPFASGFGAVKER